MAIYVCSVEIIGRNAGRSSVGAAAYRAGEDLINEYDGIEHDYRRKNWVEFTKIILPEGIGIPPDFKDRNTLWNAVEMSEKSADAQLAREFELALPIEFTREQQIEVVERFARDKLVSQGMMVDIAIHDPPDRDDLERPIDRFGHPTRDISKMTFKNPHAHVLATVRPFKDGQWTKKTEIEYLCVNKNGEEKGFTAEEFKTAKEEGWQKQYRYYEGKKKIWHTAEEGKERELERVNRAPKTTPYGRKNEKVEYWDSKDAIFEWRQHWERVVNEKFQSLGMETRIDCRSLKDQGRTDEIPTIHMGPIATNIERRAEREIREGKPETLVNRSELGDVNRMIKEHNAFVRELKAKINAMMDTAKGFLEEIANKLEGIRAKIIGYNYENEVLSQKVESIESILKPERTNLENYQAEIMKVDKANKKAAQEIKKLNKVLASCTPLQLTKKRLLQGQIRELQEQIEIREDYKQSVGRKYGYFEEGLYQEAKTNSAANNKVYNKLKTTEENLQKDTEQLVATYNEEIKHIQPDMVDELQEYRNIVRKEMETATRQKLQTKYGSNYNEDRYITARNKTDAVLQTKGSKIVVNYKREKEIKTGIIQDMGDQIIKKGRTHH